MNRPKKITHDGRRYHHRIYELGEVIQEGAMILTDRGLAPSGDVGDQADPEIRLNYYHQAMEDDQRIRELGVDAENIMCRRVNEALREQIDGLFLDLKVATDGIAKIRGERDNARNLLADAGNMLAKFAELNWGKHPLFGAEVNGMCAKISSAVNLDCHECNGSRYNEIDSIGTKVRCACTYELKGDR